MQDPVSLPFAYYPLCTEIGMAAREYAVRAPDILFNNGSLSIHSTDGSALGAMEVFDPRGRLILGITTTRSSISIDLQQVASGMLVLRSTDRYWPPLKVFIP